MLKSTFAKTPELSTAQSLECPACARFVKAVQGIRGKAFDDRGGARAARRRSYRAQSAVRKNTIVVSPAFVDLVRETCAAWLNHLGDEDAPIVHVRALPEWVPPLLEGVSFEQKVGATADARVAATLLGVSLRSVYRRAE